MSKTDATPAADRGSACNDQLGVSPLRPSYRIVRDRYCGFEVQVWRWWLPIWLQAGFANTHCSERLAVEHAKHHANPVVRYIGPL